MKRLLYLLIFVCFVFYSNAQCVKDTFHITKINCYDSVGVMAPIYSLPAIENQGLAFTIDTLYVNVGDSVNFQIGASHNAVEVSQATWLANGTISNGGFSVGFGGGGIIINTIGTYYYVCQPHAGLGMKGIIIATNNPFSYNWYNASNVLVSTNDSLISDSCGPFYVKVFDHNGIFCDSSTRFLGCPLDVVEGQINIECFGDSTGELVRYGVMGSPPYFYNWYKDNVLFSSGANDTLHTNLSSGEYRVVVNDAIGCNDSVITNFNNPPELLFHSLYFDSILCNGATTEIEVMVKGGRKININGKQYAYLLIQNNDTLAWSDTTGQSSNFISVSPGSSYLDTVFFSNILANTDSFLFSVIDSFGCTTDTTIFIDQPDSIVAQIYQENTYPTCFYHSTWIYLDSISGGIGPYSHFWTDGTSSDSIEVFGGFNRVFVTDANGCLDSTNGINVQTPPAIIVTDSIVHVNCNGNSSGQIHLQISGGTGTITTTWGFGVDPMTLSVGSYPVFINDSLGCSYPSDTSILTYSITESSPISISLLSDNPTCLNHANGNIKANISGGAPPYLISWNNGSVSDSLFGLQVGMYTISVTDTLGCVMTDSILLQSTDSLNISFTNYTASLSCYGELTAITANISGGITANGNYSILWDNGDTSNQTIIGGGIHQIIVRDDVGCEDTAIIFIASPDPLVVDTNTLNPTCLGNDGAIDVVITGGTLSYQIQWSTGETGTSISGLTAGNYWVIVIDSCGIKDSSGIVLDPYISTLNIDNFNLIQPSCSNNDGEIDITVSGGLPPYSYSWTPGGQTTSPITGLGFGSYTVLVTDDCGLETTGIYTLNQMPNTISASGFYNYLSLWSTVSVNGSNPPFTINWTSISISGDSIQGLCEGNYPITVTDSENCEDTFSVDILYNVNQLVDPSNSTIIDTSWGIAPFSYLWSDGQTTPHADSLCEGTHTVTATALGGPFACNLSESFTINALEIILDPDLTIVDCEYEFDGTIIINPSGGTPNYRYLWSTGDTIDRLEGNLNPGTYYVSLFDKNGCQLDTSIIIAAIGADCIKNVFTPNGDGDNDIWRWWKGESGKPFLYPEVTVTIYGRYGKKIYESIGYDTPWDGTNKKGKPVPDGTYFYVIILKDGAEPIRGTVTIIR